MHRGGTNAQKNRGILTRQGKTISKRITQQKRRKT